MTIEKSGIENRTAHCRRFDTPESAAICNCFCNRAKPTKAGIEHFDNEDDVNGCHKSSNSGIEVNLLVQIGRMGQVLRIIADNQPVLRANGKSEFDDRRVIGNDK